MSELALRLIAENIAAHERGEDARSLDLGNCGLTELPEALFECVWLEELLVSNSYWDQQKQKQKRIESPNNGTPNQISQLPNGFSKMGNLITLYFGGNFVEHGNLSDIQPLASLINLQSLDLAYNQITELGPLASLTSLQSLNLSSNQLTDLNPLRGMAGLKYLVISNNQLTDDTDLGPLSEMTGLQYLDLSSNELTESDNLGFLQELTGLQYLDLANNELFSLDFLRVLTDLKFLNITFTMLNDVGFLRELTKLEHLYLGSNFLTDLGCLRELTKLKDLDLSNNELTDLSFLKNLAGLQYLDLAENQITNVSFLKNLTGLKHLDLSSNQLTDVGFLRELTGLQSLNLTGNIIKEIPLDFLEAIRMEIDLNERYGWRKRILLKDNPLENPPLNVLKQGREFAIGYLKNADKQPLNECKVIIVGRGGVGKTSLQKRLTHQSFDPKESQTHGIRKVSWIGGVKTWDGQPITVHFWDFGGQDIQQTLHQFFYSKNTVYILVLNKRHDEDPEDFLELVRTYGHNSPVLVAYNNPRVFESIGAVNV